MDVMMLAVDYPAVEQLDNNNNTGITMTNSQHLSSLHIQHYRGLHNVKIEQLGKVNLLVGPNNIGKSSMLEAVWLWGTMAHPNTIASILGIRDENALFGNDSEQNLRQPRQVPVYLRGINNLFEGRPRLDAGIAPICIGQNNAKTKMLQIAITKRRQSSPIDSEGDIVGNFEEKVRLTALHTTISFDKESVNLPFTERLFFAERNNMRSWQNDGTSTIYLPSSIAKKGYSGLDELWENIDVLGKDQVVLDAMRIIVPDMEKITFVKDKNRSSREERIPVCRLKGIVQPIPLHSFGDGFARLFEIVLSVVNSNGKICLIDEFENGLHWTIQEKVWDFVFQLTAKFDIQVFATTHSLDTVNTFQKVARKQDNKDFAGIVQMAKHKGQISARSIFGDELRQVEQYNVGNF